MKKFEVFKRFLWIFAYLIFSSDDPQEVAEFLSFNGLTKYVTITHTRKGARVFYYPDFYVPSVEAIADNLSMQARSWDE